ncbi:hypothetical protein [Halobaculum gomorrense]|uniref:hypothetical protein n=1 Tax=Halobaculum gomorrense TaxID=43928 RepID=UPI00190E62CA|nr:hypothetical protein [Halobaculum gomorrense]
MVVLQRVFLELIEEQLIRIGEVGPEFLVYPVDDAGEFDLFIFRGTGSRLAGGGDAVVGRSEIDTSLLVLLKTVVL